jgi:pyridoxamine 5'-phosphate oxidase
MKKAIAHIRKSYEKNQLLESKVSANPFDQFKKWFHENLKSDHQDPTAMTLSTVDVHHQPSARIVLLKEYSQDKGFVFFTNYESKKGKEIKTNPKVSLLFFWPDVERQIRIEGNIKKVPASESEKYFQKRPRESQIGAWASEQSASIPDRKYLENTVIELEKFFEGKNKLPLPPFWGGYSVIPHYFEFWQGRKNRLHDRIVYHKKKGSWQMGRLSP